MSVEADGTLSGVTERMILVAKAGINRNCALNGANVAFEQKLWSAADELRANSKLKPSEYSMPVLGLIFLRYADHRFAHAEKELAGADIIKTKGFTHGLEYAPGQAVEYAQHFPNCRLPAVTNGCCYRLFERRPGNQFLIDILRAYLNLITLCDRYPLDPDNVPGSLDAMGLLVPGRQPRE